MISKVTLAAALFAVWAGNVVAQDVAMPVAMAVEGQGVYNEGNCYSAYTRPSYVPGFIPQASSRFENPRTFPAMIGVLAEPYFQYAGVDGWFFCSPQGYQTSVPTGSRALAYNRGELGITSELEHGYPMGQRVIEEVVLPGNSSCRRGGYFISSGQAFVPATVAYAPVATGPRNVEERTRVHGPSEQTIEK